MNLRRIPWQHANAADILSVNEPVVLVGEASDWTATKHWTFESLRERCGHAKIAVRYAGELRSWTVAELVDAILAGQSVYGVDWDFQIEFPELLAELGTSLLERQNCLVELPIAVRPRFTWLYVGAPGTGSPLHQDVLGTHAWLTPLLGSKRWVLYPPSTFTPEQARTHDAFTPDAKSVDDHKLRARYEGIIEAGDVIFVPSLWWHQVENIEATIGLTRNFCHRSIRSRVRAEAARGRYSSLVPYLDGLGWPGESG